MNVRLAINALASKHSLTKADTAQLVQWAELESPPTNLANTLPRGLALLGASLLGFGLICFLAANWDLLGRFGQFTLLQSVFLGLCLGAVLSTTARVPLTLLALLMIGGMFAYFGQSYQTGADTWTLFALWGGLGLLLCVGVRSDVLWTPWALIVNTGIALWIQAHAGHSWRIQPTDIQVYVLGWCAALALTALMNPIRPMLPGVGRWAFRAAVILSGVLIFTTALGTLLDYQDELMLYWLALGLLSAAVIALGSSHMFDIFGLSMLSLALNILLIVGIGRALFVDSYSNFEWKFLLLSVISAALLAATVKTILYLARKYSSVKAQA